MKKSQRISTAIAAMCAAAVMNAGQIKIETNGISMILESEPGHTLDLCYFGEKLMNTTEFAHAWHITQPDTGDAYGLQLYPAYGGRFFLNPALKLTHADGVITTELVYESHEQTVIDDNSHGYSDTTARQNIRCSRGPAFLGLQRRECNNAVGGF